MKQLDDGGGLPGMGGPSKRTARETSSPKFSHGVNASGFLDPTIQEIEANSHQEHDNLQKSLLPKEVLPGMIIDATPNILIR